MAAPKCVALQEKDGNRRTKRKRYTVQPFPFCDEEEARVVSRSLSWERSWRVVAHSRDRRPHWLSIWNEHTPSLWDLAALGPIVSASPPTCTIPSSAFCLKLQIAVQ
jgi:hypothetical protein